MSADILGPCRHRYTHDVRCGITLMATEYGPGHSSRPKAAHYPVLAFTTAPVSLERPGAVVSAPAEPVPARGLGRSTARLTAGQT